MEERLARIGEVLAQVVVHRHAAAGHLGLHHLVTSGTQPPRVAPALVQAFIADVVAPSTAAQIWPLVTLLHEQIWALSAGHPRPGRLGLAVAGRQDQELRVGGQRDAVQRHLQQGAVFVGVAHQHGADQALAVGLTTIFL